MKIIVTGFDPFGKDDINPSWEAVRRLPDEINGHSIIKMQLPTVVGKSADILIKAIKKNDPDYVISVGQAGGRRGITLEKIAVNINDFRIADNEGNTITDQLIEPDGPAAYFTALPVERMLERIRKEGLEASLSFHAGTFICNYLMYEIRHFCETQNNRIRSGFIHVPYIKQQVKDDRYPFMELEDITVALRCAIEEILEE